MQVTISSAISDNYLIGNCNKLPWHLPNDLKRFRKITLGKPVIMGRKTYESIGKPLSGRHNIVLSKNKNFKPSTGCDVFYSFEDAIEALSDCKEVIVIGGAEVYKQALPIATKMFLTIVHHKFDGDTYFPKWNDSEWDVIYRKDFNPDASNLYCYSFVVFKKIML